MTKTYITVGQNLQNKKIISRFKALSNFSFVATGLVAFSSLALAVTPLERRDVNVYKTPEQTLPQNTTYQTSPAQTSNQAEYGGYDQGYAQESQSNPNEQDPIWEIFNQLQSLQVEVGELRGLVEEQAYQIQQLQVQQKQHYVDLDQRVEALGAKSLMGKGGDKSVEANQSLNDKGLSSKATTLRNSSGKILAPNAEDEEHYNNALAFIRQREYKNAEQELLDILNTNPEGFYAAPAHYWLAEVYLAMPQPILDSALKHFKLVYSNFPDHTKAPAALYKVGTIFDAKKENVKAKKAMQTLLADYPDSNEAKKATEFLELL